MVSAISMLFEGIVTIGLIISLLLFIRLALKSKSIRSVEAELSIFLIVWVIAESLRAFLMMGLIQASASLQFNGIVIHTVSMVAFGAFMVSRYHRYTKRG